VDIGGWRRAPNGEYVDVDLSGVHARNVNLEGAKLSEALLVNARLSGLITGLVVNNVEVAPLIEAELNRRQPGRGSMAPSDLAGVHHAWELVQQRWQAMCERVGTLPESLLYRRVDDEWSFVETVRHLIMVIDSWIGVTILDRVDRHPYGLAPSFVTDPAALGLDPRAEPSVAEVVAVRTEKLAMVAGLIESLAEPELHRRCGNDGTVLSALQTYFSEEWEHVSYANRDLDVLTGDELR